VIVVAVVTVAAVLDLVKGRVKPYRACRVCAGRGHCIRCGLTGKVLTWAGWVMHPELRRK
jgi:hypothetical protein